MLLICGRRSSSHDVCGEEVGGELDPLEAGVHGAGEGPHHEGLREAGDAFEEDVAVGDEGDHEFPEYFFLADDDFLHLDDRFLYVLCVLFCVLVELLDFGVHGILQRRMKLVLIVDPSEIAVLDLNGEVFL